jgi:N-acetyl-1-D-myo-inositol-2-amino-2-deoxy-alpha-D-glucopyranoside deacetylase
MTEEALTLMAVHAHPDDEVFLTGGVIAKASAEGIRTVLVTATRGEEGEIHDPDLDAEEARHRLGAIREAELRRAAGILGVEELHFLGFRDSGMAGTPENENPHNLQNAELDVATARVVRLIRQTRPDVIVTYDERGGYGHPDHIAVHRATVAAVDAAGDPDRFPDPDLFPWQPRKLYYGVFSRSAFDRMQQLFRESNSEASFEPPDEDYSTFTVPDEDITTWVDVHLYLLQKQAALRAHRTQIPEDSPFFTMTNEIAGDVVGMETFIRVRSSVPAPDREDDLFAGLRGPSRADRGVITRSA